jgi:FMN-dependent oxidoreductase (nitrilotriacetate monooxygenase family)
MSFPLRPIALNAFDMNCVGHIQHGMWTHPRDQSMRYTELDYWADLARTLERGLFDGLFLADIVGVYDVFEGGPAAAIRAAAQVPVNDPMLLIPTMAYVTRHLGFGVTCNVTYEPPYLFARRMSTLDHLTRGRVGWNVVTGYLDSAARGMGLDRQLDHDRRYDMADEYMDVVYALWEGSWADDGVLRDRAAGRYADPARVRTVRHHGEGQRIDAIHLSEPSPQRTPVLYQAGSSTRGRRFAATHAECVFINDQARGNVVSLVADIRAQAAARGRDARDIKMFLGTTVVVAPTEAEARDRFEEYRAHASLEGAFAHFSASTGIDLARYDWDEPITYVKTDANNSNMEAITIRNKGAPWTKRRLSEQMILGSRHNPIVGSPSQVCDALAAWVTEADVDGFNLSRTVMPEGLEDFVSLVVPALQDRGLYKTEYAPGTYREKLFGPGRARLPSTHPAARFRHVVAPVT